MRERGLQQHFLRRRSVKNCVPADLIADTCLFRASENAQPITGTVIPIYGA
jgi:hypothetical protein